MKKYLMSGVGIFIGALGVLGYAEVVKAEEKPNWKNLEVEDQPNWKNLEVEDQTIRISATIFRGLTPNDASFEYVYPAIESVYNLPLAGEFNRSKIQEQLDKLYDTGWFSNIEISLENNGEDKYVLAYNLSVNPIIERIEITGITLPPEDFSVNLFADFPKGVLNNKEIDKRLLFLTDWYRERGYNMAQVANKSVVDNKLIIEFMEGQIADIEFQFFDQSGKQIKGRTRPDVLLRELNLLPGKIYNQELAQIDYERLVNLGIFSLVRPQLLPYDENKKQFILRYSIQELRNRQFNISANVVPGLGPGISVSFADRNFLGGRENLSLNVDYSGNNDIFASVIYKNPWVGNNPLRLGISFAGSYGLTSVNALDGGKLFIPTIKGGQAITQKIQGNLEFPFRLGRNWLVIPQLSLARITVLSSTNREPVSKDILGNRLTASGTPNDFLATVGIRFLRDTRNSQFVATKGSLIDISFKQALGFDTINFGRLIVDGAYYLPTPFIRIGERVGALALGGSLGLTYGNMPPYEAFILGGEGTVRGWSVSEIASARNYALGTIEYRFPLPLNLYGVVFVDAATDLGSQSTVPGNPGKVRGKPGSGLGYGIGLRFLNQQIGLDYAFNNQGTSQVSFSANLRF